MRCRQVLEMLPTYVSGEVPARHSEKMQEHLGLCAACGREEAALRRVLEWTAELPARFPTEEASMRIKAALMAAASLQRVIHVSKGVSPTWRTAAVVCFLAASGLAFLQIMQASGQKTVVLPPAPEVAHVSQMERATPVEDMVPPGQVEGPAIQQPKAPHLGATALAKRPFTDSAASRRSPKAIRKRVPETRKRPSPPPAAPVPTKGPQPNLLPVPAEEEMAPPLGFAIAYYVPPAPAAQLPSGDEIYLIREVPSWCWLVPPKEIPL